MNWLEECKKAHNTSLEVLRETGRCPFQLHVYPPVTSNAHVVWMEPEGLSDENRERLRRMNEMFRLLKPPGVMLSSDTWQTDNEKFGKYFGLPPNLSYEDFQNEYLRILHEKFNGSLETVPDEVKREAVVTMIKGPKIGQFSQLTFYRRKQSRIIITETKDTASYYGVVNLIPNWWNETVQ